MIYHDTSQALVGWDEEGKFAIVEWRGYIDGQDYRNVLSILFDVIVKHGASKLLADNRRMKVVTQEDQSWITQEWTPRARAAGLKWSALVVPSSALGKLSLSRMVANRPKDPNAPANRTMTFDNIEEARAWLRSRG